MTVSQVCMFLCLLAAASAENILYPSIGGSETLTCACPDHQCQRVFWYRFLQKDETLQFLLECNTVDKVNYGNNIDTQRFKASSNGGSGKFTLRITSLQQNDTGLYSCLLHSQNPKQGLESLTSPGYYIKPGEHRPTSPPPTVKPKVKNPPPCKPNIQPVKGCKPLVLWSCVGVLLVLAVLMISILTYFSRLPKKCRHQFAKKVQLN
ncbi:hypothetical protein AMEX_G20828 [Astyanax mexicanus]|uniref:Uncharacterized LOC103030369 n=2 Tax=Astyanax mexicanus TaxID=7994 RepID=A0A8B9LQ13_ASTMX|nr:hypothetical protein AMEX_G20828 [Astyanax mexicanus]